MLSIAYYPAVLLALVPIYLIYVYFTNLIRAKRINFPYVSVPFVSQNHLVWMLAGPMSRLWLKSHLPTILSDRIALAIYGYEFFERRKPHTNYIEPQLRANPKLNGRGKSYFLVTSGRFELHTWDAEIAQEVAARPKDFRQFDIGNLFMGILGANVLTTDGNEWSRHRRIVAGAVTERVSSVVWNEAVRQTDDFLTSIVTPIEDNKPARSGTTYQMFDLIKQIAINVLYAAGMGTKQEFNLDNANPTIKGGGAKRPGMKLSYIDAVKIINENTAGPNVIPNFILLNWPSWLPGAAWLHSIAYAKIEFPIHTREALARERQITAEKGEARNNVMSALIAASERNEGATDAEKGTAGKKGPALSDDEVVANLYIFTAAGFDTTTNTLAFALVLLCRYPKWQDWIISEINALIPDPDTTNLQYTEIFPHAHRLLALMLETLRIYPAIIHLSKMTQTAQTITTSTCGTFTLPANTTIYVNTIGLHTDPAIWRGLNMTDLERKSAADDEDGVDGDELIFRPARWINPEDAAQKLWTPPKGAYLPWSAGPRVCPGQRMAQVEFVAIILTLFLRHRLEPIRKYVKVQKSGLAVGAEGLDATGEKGDMYVPESDQALNERLEGLMAGSQPKLTLEMDVYDIKDGETNRGLGMRWVKRR